MRVPRYDGRNRTFFFVDYEGARIRQASGSSLLDVPSDAFRKGDLSGSTTPLYDPARRVLGSNGVASAQVFAGNVIPASRLDPAVLKYQDLMPKPNVGAPGSLARNYFEASPQQTDRNQSDVKVDHRLSEKNNLMARVSVSKQTRPNRGPGSRNLDFSLFKDIALSERKRLEFRAEAFNLSNTPTFWAWLALVTGVAAIAGNYLFSRAIVRSGRCGQQRTTGR